VKELKISEDLTELPPWVWCLPFLEHTVLVSFGIWIRCFLYYCYYYYIRLMAFLSRTTWVS